MAELYQVRWIISYLKFLIKTRTRFAIHSPFVYDFITNVINTKTSDEKFEGVEMIRTELFHNNRSIKVQDYGTGSVGNNFRKISHIARSSLKSKKEAQFLYRLIQYYKPQNILELGTSLGLTTIYLAMAGSGSRILTIEGCSETVSIARDHFKRMHLDNIELISGNINELLPRFISKFDSLDFVFFDANHTYNATIQYFLTCAQYAHNGTVFIFDDIHWSAGMEKAWSKIKAHLEVTVTIDLYHLGLVFFRKELSKQDFILRF